MSTGRRPSIANTLAAKSTDAGRVATALERGKRELEDFAKANGISLGEARSLYKRISNLGRRRSLVMGCP